METYISKEEAAITLNNEGWCTNRSEAGKTDMEVFFSDLKAAEVGAVFKPEAILGCFDFETAESLTVVFKDEHGVACLYRKEEHSYSYLEEGTDEIGLIWFEYH